MLSTSVEKRIAPSAKAASAVAALFVHEGDRDMPGVAIPRPETNLVVRFGPPARNGLDAHALGVQQRARRKVVRAGQRILTVRLRLGAQEAVLGVPAGELAGRIVALEDWWGDAATQRLYDQLAHTRDTIDAAAIVESAIAERLAIADDRRDHASLVRDFPRSHLALDAAERLASANVKAVAVDLGVSERHLRRVFREGVGVSPKAFAKLTRFHRALRAAQEDSRASWASIAAATGYYDQAHLIAEFRAIAGVTPGALFGELRGTAKGSQLRESLFEQRE
jgi:AraC-like DNA-binding protein